MACSRLVRTRWRCRQASREAVVAKGTRRGRRVRWARPWLAPTMVSTLARQATSKLRARVLASDKTLAAASLPGTQRGEQGRGWATLPGLPLACPAHAAHQSSSRAAVAEPLKPLKPAKWRFRALRTRGRAGRGRGAAHEGARRPHRPTPLVWQAAAAPVSRGRA